MRNSLSMNKSLCISEKLNIIKNFERIKKSKDGESMKTLINLQKHINEMKTNSKKMMKEIHKNPKVREFNLFLFR